MTRKNLKTVETIYNFFEWVAGSDTYKICMLFHINIRKRMKVWDKIPSFTIFFYGFPYKIDLFILQGLLKEGICW